MSKTRSSVDGSCALSKRVGVGEAKPYNSVIDMVSDPSINALWICAPNFTRLEIMEEIVNAIESGKGELIGIACEKPLGCNVKEAKQMLALAKKVDLLDGYLENQVFAPSVTKRKRNHLGKERQQLVGYI